MNLHAPVFPTDIESIRALGVENWRASFAWPVSDADYNALLDALWDAFEEVHAGLGDADADAWLADTVAPGSVAQSIHFRVAAELCARQGLSAAARGASRQLLDPNPADWRRQVCVAEMAGSSVAAAARGLAKGWILNRHLPPLPRLRALGRETRCWALGSRSPLLDAYIVTEGLAPRYFYARQVIPSASLDGAAEAVGALHDGIRHVVARLKEYCRRRWQLEIAIDTMARAWGERLGVLSAAHRALEKLKHSPAVLLLTDVSRPLHKLIALAIARRDCEVIGFQHGNVVGHLRQRSSAWHAHAHCTVFVTYTPGAARLLDRAYRASPISTRKPVQFRGAPSRTHSKLFAPLIKEPPPQGVRTVMLIGYPMNATRYQYSAGDFFAFQLHAELRIAEVLRGAGYRVIYKAHPQRMRELGDAFAGRVDEMLSEPFETTWNRADAFVFGCMTTTVFSVALLTPLPVAILDIEGLAWDSEAEALLKRRVISVPTRFDDRNRLVFDEKVLVAGLAKPLCGQNNDFVRTYLMGSGQS